MVPLGNWCVDPAAVVSNEAECCNAASTNHCARYVSAGFATAGDVKNVVVDGRVVAARLYGAVVEVVAVAS